MFVEKTINKIIKKHRSIPEWRTLGKNLRLSLPVNGLSYKCLVRRNLAFLAETKGKESFWRLTTAVNFLKLFFFVTIKRISKSFTPVIYPCQLFVSSFKAFKGGAHFRRSWGHIHNTSSSLQLTNGHNKLECLSMVVLSSLV